MAAWDKDPVVETETKKPWESDPEVGEKPGVVEDVAKAAPVGLAQGVIGLAGTGGDLQQLAKAGAAKVGADPLGYLTGKLDQVVPGFMKFARESNAKSANAPIGQVQGEMPGTPLPSSSDIQGQMEKATGPFYQAQTPVGKGVQTATQVLPALATGGGGVVPMLAKAAGAGALSEGAGAAADALKGHLPTAVQPYAEPIARAGGAILGTGIPGLARSAATPLPMTNERMAMVNALRQTNPELINASSAGQLTQSPRVAAMEVRSPRMAGLPQRQEEAYTQGVMRQAGAPAGSLFDTAGLTAAKNRGDELATLRNAHTMSPPEYMNLKNDLRHSYVDLSSSVGRERAAPLLNFNEDVRLGPNRGAPGFPTGARSPLHPTDMPGDRFGDLSQAAQAAGSGAAGTQTQTALFDARQRLKDAFHASMPPDEAARLQNLDRQYSNYKTIENINPGTASKNTITPDQVFAKTPRGHELETHATQASGVMTPLPAPTEGGPASRVFNSLAGGAIGSAIGYGTGGGLKGAGSEGLLGAFMGAGHGSDYLDVLKNQAARVVAHPWTQEYLKNQRFRPDPNRDRAAMARILMTPPVQQVTDQSK